MNTPVSSMVWVLIGSFFGSIGALFLKMGAERLQKNLGAIVANWRLGLGIAFYLLSSVFYMLGVKNGELSVLYPMVSLGSVWTLAWSSLFLREKLTRVKFLAVGLILVGVAILGLGTPHKTVSQTAQSSVTSAQQ